MPATLRYQYQGKAEPVLPEALRPESPHPDAFVPQTSEPVRVKAPRRLGTGAFDFEPIPEPVETISLDKWHREAVPPNFRKGRAVDVGWYAFQLDESQQPESPHLDAFWVQPSEPVRVKKSRLGTGSVAFQIDDFPEAPHLDAYWRNDNAVPVQPKHATRPGLISFFEMESLAPPEVVTLDKWWRETSAPLFGKGRPVDEGWHAFEIDTFPESPHLDAYWRPASEPVRVKKSAMWEGLHAFQITDFPESPHLDAFWLQPSEPVRVKKVPVGEGLYVLQLTDFEEEPRLKWWRPASEPVRTKKRPTDVGLWAHQINDFTEAPHLDAFWQQASEPVRVTKHRTRPGYVAFYDIESVSAAETITLDKWWREAVIAPLPKPRPLDVGWSALELDEFTEQPHLDAFWRDAVIPTLPKPRPHIGWLGFLDIEDTSEPEPEPAAPVVRVGYTPGRILVIKPRPQPQFYELDGTAFGFLFVDLEPQWLSVIDPATILLNPFAVGLISAELGMHGRAQGALGAMGRPHVETFDELWARLKAREADDQERDELRLLGLDGID